MFDVYCVVRRGIPVEFGGNLISEVYSANLQWSIVRYLEMHYVTY